MVFVSFSRTLALAALAVLLGLATYSDAEAQGRGGRDGQYRGGRGGGGVGVSVGTGLVILGIMAARWLRGRDFRPAISGTRFAKSFYGLISLLRIALTTPAIVAIVIFVLDGFSLVPPRIMEMGLGLMMAVAVATFGRGVATGLFAPDDPDRRLVLARIATSHGSVVVDDSPRRPIGRGSPGPR